MKRRKTLRVATIVAILLRFSDPAYPGPPSGTRAGGITTLYAYDPLASSLSFGDGEYGHVFHDNELKNRNSDIDFGSYGAGELSVGIEGGRVGAIVDLGTGRDLQQRYQYSDTVGAHQGFASLRLENGQLVIRKGQNERQPVKEAELLSTPKSVARAPVASGHIYIVRIVDTHDASFERMAKLVVLESRVNESVTFRWERLK